MDIQLDNEDIKTYREEQFRRLVKGKLEKFAGKYLEEIRISHSKTENIKFKGFTPAVNDMQTLFRLRTRMIDVKDNFSSSNITTCGAKLAFC